MEDQEVLFNDLMDLVSEGEDTKALVIVLYEIREQLRRCAGALGVMTTEKEY